MEYSTLRSIHRQQGFTIVELLIVVVVIAILATITIIAYNGIQNSAIESSIKNDLKTAKSEFMNSLTRTDSYPNSLSYTPGNGAIASVNSDNTANPKTFCITISKGTRSFYVTQDSGITQGACPVSNVITWANSGSSSASWFTSAISNDGQRMVATQYSGATVFTSADGGATWTNRVGAGNAGVWRKSFVSGDGLTMFVSGSGILRKSTDGGVNWTNIAMPSGVTQTSAFDVSDDGSVLLLGATSGSAIVYVSTDSGTTWTTRTMPTGTAVSDAVISGNNQHLFVTANAGGTCTLYHSTNYGAAWTSRSTVGCNIAVNTGGDSLVALGGASARFSTDYGANLITRSLPVGSSSSVVHMSADGNVLITRPFSSGAIYSTINSGVSWEESSLASGSWTSANVSANGKKFIATQYSMPVQIGSRP